MGKEVKYKIGSLQVYYFGVLLYVLSLNLQLTYMFSVWTITHNPMIYVIRLLRYISYILFGFRIISLKRINRKLMIVIIFLGIIALIASFSGTSNAPMFSMLLMVGAIDTDFSKIVKVFAVVQSTVFFLCIISSLFFGIGGGSVLHGNRIRFFLGYGWVNSAPYSFFFICLELLYLYKGKIKILMIIVLSIINGYLYVMTMTLFPMILTYLTLLISVLFHQKKLYRKMQVLGKKRIALYFFVVSVVIGLTISIFYDDSSTLWRVFNSMVTGRLALAKNAILEYGLHLWGNKLEWVGSSTLLYGLSKSKEYFYVDSCFLNLALEFGLLYSGFIAYIYYSCIKSSIYYNNFTILLCYIILSIAFVFEPYAVDFSVNPFILYFFCLSRLKQNMCFSS